MPGFDTLRFVHELELVGISRTQAEGHARAFAGAYNHVQEQMATKQDLERTQVALKTDIDSLRDNTKADIAALSAEKKDNITTLREDIASLRAEMGEGFARIDASFQSLSTSIAWIKWTSTGMVTLCLASAGACFEMLKRVSTVIQ